MSWNKMKFIYFINKKLARDIFIIFKNRRVIQDIKKTRVN